METHPTMHLLPTCLSHHPSARSPALLSPTALTSVIVAHKPPSINNKQHGQMAELVMAPG